MAPRIDRLRWSRPVLVVALLAGACGETDPVASTRQQAEPAPAALPGPPPAPLAQAPFEARRERALKHKPAGVCAADFDGDGRDDLALTFLTPGGCIAWRAGASGLARDGEAQAFDEYPLAPLALPAGRFGAAPKERWLALASRASRKLEIVRAFPGAAAASTLSLVLEKTPRAQAAGVVAGKGLLAIACDDQRLELLREGATVPEHGKLSAGVPRCALVCEELGRVLVGFQESSSIEAYDAADATPRERLALGGFPRDLAALDVDADGDPELVVAGGEHELWIFGAGANTGARGWFETAAPLVWTTGAIPLQLAVADFDADHRADLAVLHHYDLSVRLFTKLSAAGAGASASLYAGQTPVGLAALDADGDERTDVAVLNRDTQGLGLLPGDGAGGFDIGTSIALGKFPNALSCAPQTLAKTSELRLVALNAKVNTLSAVVWRAGALQALPAVPVGNEPRAPLIAELDGAAGPDLLCLCTNPRGAELRLFSGDLTGKLSHAALLELGGAASDLLLADVDVDGSSELAVADPTNGAVTLYEAKAARCDAAGLQGAARFAVGGAPIRLRAIQLDEDPAPEIACVLTAPGSRTGVAWLDPRREKSGALQLVELGFTPLPGAPIDAAPCDLDGDGRADLAVLALTAPNATEGSWTPLVRSTGHAEFRAGSPLLTGLRPHRIAAADLDGDGRAEVFVAAQDSHLVNAWTPDGPRGGKFELRAWDDLGAGRGPLDLGLCDVDGDGRLDLCVVNGFSDDVTVLHGRAGVKVQ
ncbi:MAG TPA: VCBS repeat-containing protein [Planctomycetota bacterium]|nr:VCBS repeat-containing protein [Planctomycetota bacterium]